MLGYLKQIHVHRIFPTLDCKAHYDAGERRSGIYTLTVSDITFQVYCNMTDGGWTILQHRFDGRLSFNKTMQEYVDGFGYLNGEFWLGLKYMHLLTQSQPLHMKLEVKTTTGEWRHIMFSRFSVGSAATNYTLSVSGFQNNSGLCSYIFEYHNGRPFLTGGRCGIYPFGWWFESSCYGNAINGLYGLTNNYRGFFLHCAQGLDLISSTLKLQ